MTDVRDIELGFDARPPLKRGHESREVCGRLDRTNNGYAYKTQEHDNEYAFTLERAAFLVRLSEVAYADPGEPALARNCHDAGLHSPGYFIQNDGTGAEVVCLGRSVL